MTGTVLFPLNQLKDRYPAINGERKADYTGSPAMGLAVPLLNCHWNDVLFLSPIHPSRICDLRVETGYPRVLRRYYQVGPARSGITNDNAVIFRHRIYEPHQNQLPEEDFVPFDSDRLAEYEEIPQKAARYYRKMFRKHY